MIASTFRKRHFSGWRQSDSNIINIQIKDGWNNWAVDPICIVWFDLKHNNHIQIFPKYYGLVLGFRLCCEGAQRRFHGWHRTWTVLNLKMMVVLAVGTSMCTSHEASPSFYSRVRPRALISKVILYFQHNV